MMLHEPRFNVGDVVYGLARGAADEYRVSGALTVRKITIEVWRGEFVIEYDMQDSLGTYAEKDLFRDWSRANVAAEQRNTEAAPLKAGDLVYVVVLGAGAFEVKGRFPIKRVIEERNDDVHTYYIVDHRDGTRREHHNRCVFKSFDLALETMTRRNGKGWSLGKDYGMGEARLQSMSGEFPCFPVTVCPHCYVVLR